MIWCAWWFTGLLQMQLILHYDETYREVKYGILNLQDIDSRVLMGINVTPVVGLLYTPVLIRWAKLSFPATWSGIPAVSPSGVLPPNMLYMSHLPGAAETVINLLSPLTYWICIACIFRFQLVWKVSLAFLLKIPRLISNSESRSFAYWCGTFTSTGSDFSSVYIWWNDLLHITLLAIRRIPLSYAFLGFSAPNGWCFLPQESTHSSSQPITGSGTTPWYHQLSLSVLL